MEQTEKTVLALGFFDGIHIGHGALLRRAKERAEALGVTPAVLTFDVHPDILVKGVPVALINNAADRALILARYFGITKILYFPFNNETARTPWQDFLDRMVEEHGAVGFVVGHDFRFGDRGMGNPEKLRGWCEARGLSCDVIPAVSALGGLVSSTRIRALIQDGQVEQADQLLGHPHLLSGTVLHGFRNGRAMEFPTLNLRFDRDVLVPRHGVYATRVLLADGTELGGVTNVGVRPTFGGEDGVTVETHLLHFHGDLYGQTVTVEFLAFLRPERSFDSPDALKEQIRQDAAAAETIAAGKA